METVDTFTGEYRFLSNFFPAVVVLEDDEYVYPTVEHAYQAAKTLNLALRGTIANTSSPGTAKRLGRRVPIQEGWDLHLKYTIMQDLLNQKFVFGGDLGTRLLSTGDAVLVEGNNWHDTIWGVCHCPREFCRGRGTNILGWLLMQRRNELKNQMWLSQL